MKASGITYLNATIDQQQKVVKPDKVEVVQVFSCVTKLCKVTAGVVGIVQGAVLQVAVQINRETVSGTSFISVVIFNAIFRTTLSTSLYSWPDKCASSGRSLWSEVRNCHLNFEFFALVVKLDICISSHDEGSIYVRLVCKFQSFGKLANLIILITV